MRKTKSALQTKGVYIDIVKQLLQEQGQQCGSSKQYVNLKISGANLFRTLSKDSKCY